MTPGETALAFYTATNLTDRPIIGIATYNVIPFDAGQYFNKIQAGFVLQCCINHQSEDKKMKTVWKSSENCLQFSISCQKLVKN